MRTLWTSLSSLRLAFGLLAALCILIVVSAVVPQEGYAEHEMLDLHTALGDGYAVLERLGFTRIYTSPVFFTILGLLGLNLIAGNIRRFRTVYRTERTLVRTRHLGSILFHFSLILIMASVIGNYLLKFRGTLAVTEGQTLQDAPLDYFVAFSGPLRRGQAGRFSMRLEGVDDGLGGAVGRQRSASVFLFPSGVQEPLRADLAMNHPLTWNGMEFHLGRSVGYSPEVLLEDVEGRVLFRGFIRLATRTEGADPVFSDFVLLSEEDLRVSVTIIPVADHKPGRFVTVERGAEVIFEGPVKEEEMVTFAGYRLGIPQLRRWAYVDVVESPFQGTIFLGFWLGLAGLSITLVPRVIRPGGFA